MSFTMSDMLYDYPSSNDWDNKRLKGHPDRDLLSRTEKYEVHDFICRVLKDLGAELNLENGQAVEKIIRKKLPSNIKLRSEAQEWINEFIRNN